MSAAAPSARSTIKRLPDRGTYEKQQILDILDEGLVAHVGIVQDGLPLVIPMGYARWGDKLLLHGSLSSRLMKTMKAGADICVTVTLLDGLVLARSVFHHSMNYRSVVVFGHTQAITEAEEKSEALAALVEQLVPGRNADTRQPNKSELTSTTVVSVPLTEASAKTRTGPPKDDKPDYAMDTWAGVLPLHQQAPGQPIDDSQLRAGIRVPSYVTNYIRPVGSDAQQQIGQNS